MKDEIKIAVKWWADQLRDKPKFDNGEPMHGALFSILADRMAPIPEEQVQKFEVALTEILESAFEENWRPDEPNWSSAIRCLGVDYGADHRLTKAAERAGFDPDNRFPCKTNMWVDPGSVKVSCGYGAPIEVLYDKNALP